MPHTNPCTGWFCYSKSLIPTLLFCCTLQGSTPGDSRFQMRIPVNDQPRITVNSVGGVHIETWDRQEVWLASEAVPWKAYKINSSKQSVEITCCSDWLSLRAPVGLALRVPAGAMITIRLGGSFRAEVRKPGGTIFLVQRVGQILVDVPESAEVDLRQITNAFTVQHRPHGLEARPSESRVLGSGPPHLKITSTHARVLVGHGYLLQAARERSMSRALRAVARAEGRLGEALRKLQPDGAIPPAPEAGAPDSAADKGVQPLVRVESRLVNVHVSVSDRAGKAISGLKATDFLVYDAGVEQQVTHFSTEEMPFNLVLLIDLSGSVREKADLIRDTALHFLEVVKPEDSVAVFAFATDVEIVSHLTKDRELLRDRLACMRIPAGGTYLYDALAYVLAEELREVRGDRNAVVLITDGQDNSLHAQPWNSVSFPVGPYRIPHPVGSQLSFEQILEGVSESGALIYPVHLTPELPQGSPVMAGNWPLGSTPPWYMNIDLLCSDRAERLASASGGRLFIARKIEDLSLLYERVAADLRTIYSLAYAPSDAGTPGKWRRIQVRVKSPGAVVRARTGYYPR